MVKEKYKTEEHITPEQFTELVQLHRKIALEFYDMRRIYRKILGRSGRPSRYKKSPKQTAKEILRQNIRTAKDVKQALEGTLPVEAPASGPFTTSGKRPKGSDLGTNFPFAGKQ